MRNKKKNIYEKREEKNISVKSCGRNIRSACECVCETINFNAALPYHKNLLLPNRREKISFSECRKKKRIEREIQKKNHHTCIDAILSFIRELKNCFYLIVNLAHDHDKNIFFFITNFSRKKICHIFITK